MDSTSGLRSALTAAGEKHFSVPASPLRTRAHRAAWHTPQGTWLVGQLYTHPPTAHPSPGPPFLSFSSSPKCSLLCHPAVTLTSRPRSLLALASPPQVNPPPPAVPTACLSHPQGASPQASAAVAHLAEGLPAFSRAGGSSCSPCLRALRSGCQLPGPRVPYQDGAQLQKILSESVKVPVDV